MNISVGHIAFTCKDVEVTAAFYRDIIGLKHKFTLYYGDILEYETENARREGREVSESTVRWITPIKDKLWITYYELPDGRFLELFDAGSADIPCVPNSHSLNYNHVAFVVDDIHAAYEELKRKNVPVDNEPKLGMEKTWQMWSHDPDGNRIEFMQYTTESWQLTGRPDNTEKNI